MVMEEKFMKPVICTWSPVLQNAVKLVVVPESIIVEIGLPATSAFTIVFRLS
jgi:hypothetical protein